MRIAVILLLVSGVAAAEPISFLDRSGGLPIAHEYTGGWEHFVGGGVAVFDCNDDDLPDLFAAGGEGPSSLFINKTEGWGGDIEFGEGQHGANLTGVTGAYPLDVDSDGNLDLYVLRVGPNTALKGLGDCKFEQANEAWGLGEGEAWSTSFSATWEPGQDWPTLAVGNYVDRDDPEGPFGSCDANALYRPNGAGYGAPVKIEPGFCALSMLISDWTRSGRPDLRVSNDRHYYVKGGYEQMWRLDTLTLLGEADGWDKFSIWGMGIASQDLNQDGRPEVFLTSMGDQILQFSEGKSAYRNAPFDIGTYAQRPHIGDDGRPSTGWHAEFGDVNNDGLADLFIAKGNVDQMPGNAMEDPNNLLVQTPDGNFVERSIEAGVASVNRSRGAALADLNGDGRLDIVVINRRAPLEVWQNSTGSDASWLAVDLQRRGPNTRGIGAWVEVRTPSGVQAREVTIGGGHAGGQALPLHFGIGDAQRAEIRVIWPGGSISEWQMHEANQVVTLSGDDAG